jgi:hypothetical protein
MGTDAPQITNGSVIETAGTVKLNAKSRRLLRRQLARDGAVVLVLAFMAGFNFGLILRARR